MSNVLALTKVLIKNNVFAFNGKKKKGKQVSTKSSVIGFIILITFCTLCIGGPMVYLLSDLLKQFDFSNLVLSFVLPLGGITSIIFGIFSIISVFYFNKDSEKLLPLPIKSSELLLAKFFSALFSEYLLLIMFIYPIIFGVGIGISASFVYYLYSLIICTLMPIIPSVIMAIILMVFNKIFDFGKRKDASMYVMTGIILIFSFAYSFGMQFFLDNGENQELLLLLSGENSGYLKLSRWLFPFFNSAVYSLTHSNEFIGFASLMTFIGLNLIFMVVLYFVGDKLYISGLTKHSGNKQNKKENIKEIYKEKKGGVTSELIKKEWLVIKRTPVFMLNIIIVNLIFPILLAFSFLMSFSGEMGGLNMLSEMIDFNNAGVMFIAIGALMFICSMSTATSSCISREGNNAWMMKAIPVSLKKQLDAKVYFSMIIDLIILLVTEVGLMILFKAPFIYLLLINPILVLLLLIINYVSLLLDLRKPRLDWNDESEAVKQNFNVFLAMVLVMVIAALFIVLGIYIIKYDFNIYLASFISVVLLLPIYIAINVWIKKNQVKLFNKVG